MCLGCSAAPLALIEGLALGSDCVRGPRVSDCRFGTRSERVVNRSTHACFAGAKHERDLGSGGVPKLL
jgi:hypothetical protein